MRRVLAVVAFAVAAAAQPYDLLLKGGHVIDPKNKINSVMDVAVAKGKIARVAANIPASEARRVADVKGAGDVWGRNDKGEGRSGAGDLEDALVDPPLGPMRLKPLRLIDFFELHGGDTNIAWRSRRAPDGRIGGNMFK